jgi:hypothetical protein
MPDDVRHLHDGVPTTILAAAKGEGPMGVRSMMLGFARRMLRSPCLAPILALPVLAACAPTWYPDFATVEPRCTRDRGACEATCRTSNVLDSTDCAVAHLIVAEEATSQGNPRHLSVGSLQKLHSDLEPMCKEGIARACTVRGKLAAVVVGADVGGQPQLAVAAATPMSTPSPVGSSAVSSATPPVPQAWVAACARLELVAPPANCVAALQKADPSVANATIVCIEGSPRDWQAEACLSRIGGAASLKQPAP